MPGPRGLLLTLLAALALALPAPAAGQAPRVVLGKGQTGWISLAVTGQPGATAEIREVVGDVELAAGSVPIGAGGRGEAPQFAQWRCFRRERTFVALGPGGERGAAATITTPSCSDRLTVRVDPPRPRVGRRVTVSVADRWRLGDVPAELCLRAPSARQRCRALPIPPGQRTVRTRVKADRGGAWRVAVELADTRVAGGTFTARRPGGRLRLLATGDSMIQIIDSFLDQRLEGRRRTRVKSDAHISTGISKPAMFDWRKAARRQAGGYRPNATVVFLGANDGFPMRGVACCGDAWVKEYARRARAMMRAYLRRGRGRVYWCLLPVPRRAAFAEIYRAVNRAGRRAARAYPEGVRIVDLPRVFTPGGRFRAQMRHRGRTVTVRQDDGIHLNTTGASIAAGVIIRALRADGLVR